MNVNLTSEISHKMCLPEIAAPPVLIVIQRKVVESNILPKMPHFYPPQSLKTFAPSERCFIIFPKYIYLTIRLLLAEGLLRDMTYILCHCISGQLRSNKCFDSFLQTKPNFSSSQSYEGEFKLSILQLRKDCPYLNHIELFITLRYHSNDCINDIKKLCKS